MKRTVAETPGISTEEDSDPCGVTAPSRLRPYVRRPLGWAQLLRFGMVGGLNTTLDLLTLNILLLLMPTSRPLLIALYTVIAYMVGAANSFLLNKFWTFRHKQHIRWRELSRFTLTTLLGIGWNSLCLWFASTIAHPLITNPVIWANTTKVLAIGSGTLISFLAMRLWVFIN